MSDQVGKVDGEKPLTWIKVFYSGGVPEARNPGLNTRVVRGPVCHRVVYELHVIHPTVDHLKELY